MKKLSRKCGFTLVELMVSALVGAVLALVVGSMIVFGYLTWSNNTTAVKLQNDTSLAMAVLGRQIRESNINDIRIGGVAYSDNPVASGNTLDFAVNSVRTNPVSIVEAGNRLLLQPDGFVLVEDGLENGFTAQFNPVGPKVEIRLIVRGARGMGDAILYSSFTPRN